MTDQTEAFDRAGRVDLALTDRNLEVTVRYPTDEEWLVYLDSFDLVRRNGITTKTRCRDQAAKEFLACIREDAGGPIFAVDAGPLIDLLYHSSTIAASQSEVTIEFMGRFQSSHKFQPMAVADRTRHSSCFHEIPARGGGVRVLVDWSGLASLYDSLITESHGYVGSIPVHHKIKTIESLFSIER